MRSALTGYYPTRPMLGYGVAVLSVLVTLFLYWLLGSSVQSLPFLFFFGAVAFSAWFGGLGPGLLTTFLSAIAVIYFLFPPAFTVSLNGTELWRVFLFIVVASLINGLSYARSQALVAVERERALWQTTVASIGDAIISTDQAGKVFYMNGVAESLTEWSLADATGRGLHEVFNIVNETTREPVESPYSKVMRVGNVVGLANHTIIIGKHGTERPIDDSGAPIRDEEGRIVGVVLVFRDIAERYKAEHALRESEARFRILADSAPVLMWLADTTGARIFFNKRWLDFTGRTLEEDMGMSWAEDLHPDDRRRYLDTLQESVRTKTGSTSEFRLRKADGKYCWMLDSRVPVWGSEGEFNGYIGSCIDITEMKEAEAERTQLLEREREARHDAELAQERLAFLAEASRVLASSLDYETTLATVTREAVPELADWCAVDVLDQEGVLRRLAVAHIDPARVEWAHELWERFPPRPEAPTGAYNVIRTGKTEFLPEITDEMLVAATSDPELLNIVRGLGLTSAITAPLTARGRTLGVLSLVMAESGRKYDGDDVSLAEDLALRAANAIENSRLYKEAQDAIRVRDQFVSIASHELRTPLSAMLGYTQLAKRRVQRTGTLGAQEIEMLDTVEKQAKRLNRMVSSMLDLSRIETGQLSIERAPVDLVALAQRIVEEMQPTLGKHRLVLSYSSDKLVVEGDELRLDQVVQNLINNAAKYSPDGGPIDVTVRDDDGMACIAVTDRGIGIPEAAQERLFQRFYRVPNADTHRFSGMGIGLYVVKEIVNLHGGKVSVRSKEGEGSTFTICIPMRGAPGRTDM